MHKANTGDFDNVMSYFKQHKSVFPHIRTDKVMEQIKKQNAILENGVLITYGIYKKKTKLGDTFANKHDAILHQIATKELGKGNAVVVINDFFDYVGTNVFLTVREENIRAIKFYEKVGMTCIGNIDWGFNKQIKGKVYVKSHTITLL
jgi:hypothetical protein